MTSLADADLSELVDEWLDWTQAAQILEGLRGLAESLNKSGTPAVSGLLPIGEPAPARDIVEETYAFNARLLDLNKAFAINVLDLLTPASTPAKTTKKS